MGNPIENASIIAHAFRSIIRICTCAEKHIEDHSWISNHRKRLGRRCPTDRIDVHTRVVVGAASRLIDAFNSKLNGRERRILTKTLGIDLIEGRTAEDVRTLSLLRMGLGQIDRAGTEMVATQFAKL